MEKYNSKEENYNCTLEVVYHTKGTHHEKQTEIVWSINKPGWGDPSTKPLSGSRLFPWKKTEIAPNFTRRGGGGGHPIYKPKIYVFFLVKGSFRRSASSYLWKHHVILVDGTKKQGMNM